MPENPLPLGPPVPGWVPRPVPPRVAMTGRWCRVEPLDGSTHATDLFAANSRDMQGRMWTYLNEQPFASEADYRAWVERAAAGDDPLFFAIVDLASGEAHGLASYLRIEPGDGVIEVGNITYSPLLQRTTAATEAMYLMMRRAFDELGYRRYEWKCNALNAGSRSAALRLGFTYEGTFRQARVVKGRNRDTAWYSITDAEWPRIRTAFEAWLDPANFDAAGHQLSPLEARE